MHRWTRSTIAALAIGSLGLAACGDDDDDTTGPGNSGDELTVVETQALVEVLLGGALFGMGGSFSQASAGDLQAGSPPFSESINETESCALGGNVKLTGNANGNFDENTGAGNMNVKLDMVHAGCKGQASTGEVFTINGAPKLTTEFDWVSGETSFSFDGGMNGTVKWATGSKEGTCAVTMSFALAADYAGENYTGSSTGTVCGQSINDTF